MTRDTDTCNTAWGMWKTPGDCVLTGRMEFNHKFFYSLFNPLEVFFQSFILWEKKKSVIPEDPAKPVKLVLPEGST